MPSEQVMSQKQALVKALTEQLKSSSSGVLIDYKGINVADDTALRKEFREAGIHYSVVKNTMLRFAAKNTGLDDLVPSLEGTTAIALSENDPVAPAKIATKYADKIKKGFDIKSGFMDGSVLSAEKMIEVGNLPSKEQLVAQLLSVLTGNIRGMAVALNAIAEQKESA